MVLETMTLASEEKKWEKGEETKQEPLQDNSTKENNHKTGTVFYIKRTHH